MYFGVYQRKGSQEIKENDEHRRRKKIHEENRINGAIIKTKALPYNVNNIKTLHMKLHCV